MCREYSRLKFVLRLHTHITRAKRRSALRHDAGLSDLDRADHDCRVAAQVERRVKQEGEDDQHGAQRPHEPPFVVRVAQTGPLAQLFDAAHAAVAEGHPREDETGVEEGVGQAFTSSCTMYKVYRLHLVSRGRAALWSCAPQVS
ncbi:hypothetical protein NHX12_003309 [Muraenolepis orangiensis]|uniref:Uncharacterized protein n=1 Tax=Muraenolepis orangiensis TaxID=630683 RepID=A0A9Q0DYS2_9TELE|nr:hypothetical protein NHX12_003309 [Muraenolepis orangiensis]